MKPILENIKSHQDISSFYAYRFQIPFFEFKWHYHPEYELTYIVKGNGYRLVGNNHEQFQDGDLVLLGCNLPHTWVGKSDDDTLFEAIVIQFTKEFINRFLDFEESVLLKSVLEKSERGLVFNSMNLDIKKELIQLIDAKGLNRISKLLSVLNQVSKTYYQPLSSSHFQFGNNKNSAIRINKVCGFIQNHFNEKISLKQVADLVFLTESNFCKFFKKATGKTYSDYLNDIRINEATYMLLQSEKSINQIAYECGFETLNYFNRVFLKKKNVAPSVFRKNNFV